MCVCVYAHHNSGATNFFSPFLLYISSSSFAVILHQGLYHEIPTIYSYYYCFAKPIRAYFCKNFLISVFLRIFHRCFFLCICIFSSFTMHTQSIMLRSIHFCSGMVPIKPRSFRMHSISCVIDSRYVGKMVTTMVR